MIETGFTTLIILFSVVVSIVIIAFLAGKKAGARREDMGKIEAGKEHVETLSTERTRELQREIDILKGKNQEYTCLLVRIPDAVRNLNSNLSYDETLSAIIRLTRDMVDTDTIELYIFNREMNSLELESAYGSKKEQKVYIQLGDGIIGSAAEKKVMIYRTSAQYSTLYSDKDEGIDIAVPLLFKGKLLGVIGLGKVEERSGNEKRFISMVADFAGVALENCGNVQNARKDAITDSVTELYNKEYFFERAIEAAQKASEYNIPLSISIFDIDYFKNYNDVNGHVEGDYLLKEISKLIKDNSRGTDLVSRYGPDEFIVLLPNTEKNGSFIYAEKIRSIIKNHPFNHREKQPDEYVSISGGIATFPIDGDTMVIVVRCAGEALYRSKNSGRNIITKY